MKKYILPILSIIIFIILISITCFALGAIFANQKSKQPIITQNIVTQNVITQIIITKISPTKYPTYTIVPPELIIVTATPIPSTSTPIIPAASQTPSAPTQPPLTADHNPGIYLVNVDIAPGVWRNNGTEKGCYWEITDRQGKIIQNFFGQAGGTIYIPQNAFQITLEERCGTWTYLGPP